jgi:hypothetical protein
MPAIVKLPATVKRRQAQKPASQNKEMAKATDPRTPQVPVDMIQIRLSERMSARDARCVIRRLLELETATGDEPQGEWTMSQLGYVFSIKNGIVHRICSISKHLSAIPPCRRKIKKGTSSITLAHRSRSIAPFRRNKSVPMFKNDSILWRRADGSGVLFVVMLIDSIM